MINVPRGFPEMTADMAKLFDTVGKRKTGYANAALMWFHVESRAFWCVPCRASEFSCTSRDPSVARQPTVRCGRCRRRWRVRDGFEAARSLPAASKHS